MCSTVFFLSAKQTRTKQAAVVTFMCDGVQYIKINVRDGMLGQLNSCRITDCHLARPGSQALCYTFAQQTVSSQQCTDKLKQGISRVAEAIMGLSNYSRKTIHSCACCQSQQSGCLQEDIRGCLLTCAKCRLPIPVCAVWRSPAGLLPMGLQEEKEPRITTSGTTACSYPPCLPWKKEIYFTFWWANKGKTPVLG